MAVKKVAKGGDTSRRGDVPRQRGWDRRDARWRGLARGRVPKHLGGTRDTCARGRVNPGRDLQHAPWPLYLSGAALLDILDCVGLAWSG